MFELKSLHPDGIPAALEKAIRYRLLNEPWQAASICEDILAVEPDNQEALITQLLALTDQFGRERGADARAARELLPRLEGEYAQTYYAGIIAERRAKAHLARGGPGSGAAAYEALRQAMEHYEKAEELRPPGNDDSILRWNTCVRIFQRHPNDLQPMDEEPRLEPQLE
jgi:tetratricopeptide (TPR) repeat protein